LLRHLARKQPVSVEAMRDAVQRRATRSYIGTRKR
jgi:hypothetical protein